ncbi:hypothetical protein ABIB85_005119 [Bradyrhizobium sp. JR1.5]|uniref:hypothetical protein n=1 Tax=unclassified Bradyrhizobium TaxID=2631580 RepID=UPI00339882C1
MTSSSTHLVERVRELVANGAVADERIDALVLRGRLPSVDAQIAWLGFVDDVPTPFSSLQVYNPALGGDLVTGDIFDSTREIVITLGKPTADGCARHPTLFGATNSAPARRDRRLEFQSGISRTRIGVRFMGFRANATASGAFAWVYRPDSLCS